jgi:hypothetical protein
MRQSLEIVSEHSPLYFWDESSTQGPWIQHLRPNIQPIYQDPCEFVRVDNDANRLNLPILHIHGQDGEDLTAGADDQGGLTVDFLELNTSVLWPKALRSQAKACHRIAPDNRTKRGLFDFPTAISPPQESSQ